MNCKCKYPGCPAYAVKTWALVPLCDGHHENIRWETVRYYQGKNAQQERAYYKKIEHLTPWKRK